MPSLGSNDRRYIGMFLLVVVNILWVLSSELTSVSLRFVLIVNNIFSLFS